MTEEGQKVFGLGSMPNRRKGPEGGWRPRLPHRRERAGDRCVDFGGLRERWLVPLAGPSA